MTQKILTFAVLVFGMNAFAQTKNIDDDLKKCVDEATSTTAQRNCVATAEKLWDAELNRNYKILMAKLPAGAQEKLKESQRKWLAFRDSETKFIAKYNFEVKQGTIFQVMADTQRMRLVHIRASELVEFVKMLDE